MQRVKIKSAATMQNHHLAREISRVLSSVYIPSLKSLRDILQEADDAEIHQWVNSHCPAEIEGLASLVQEGILSQPYGIDILRKLSVSRAFRDEILFQEPRLLETFLSKSLKSSRDDFEENSKPCLALLSGHPLPSDIALPASAEPFFVRVVENALNSFSMDSLRSVYKLLKASCISLPQILPQTTFESFVERLQDHLRHKRKSEEGHRLVLCFGILKSLVLPHGVRQEPQQQQSSPQYSKCIHNALTYFEEKAPQSIHFLCLKALQALRPAKSGIQYDEALDTLEIAIEALAVIDRQIRLQWSSEQQPYLYKLVAIAKEEKHHELQISAFAILSLMTEVTRDAPSNLVPCFEQLLLSNAKQTTECSSMMSLALAKFAPFMSDKFITQLVKKASTSLKRDPEQLASLITIFRELSEMTRTCSSLRLSIARAVASDEAHSSLETLLKHQLVDVVMHTAAGSCNYVLAEQTRMLSLNLCEMIWTAMWNNPEATGSILPDDFPQLILQKLQSCAAKPDHRCQRVRRANMPSTVPIFETSCTPDDCWNSRTWKESLQSLVHKGAAHQAEDVHRLFAHVLRDFEKRCETVEEPLMKEQSKANDLTVKLESATLRIQELEDEDENRELFIRGIEVEKKQVFENLQHLELEKQDLESNVQALQQQVEALKAAAREQAKLSEEQAQNEQLQYRGALSSKDQTLRAKEEELALVKEDRDRVHQRSQSMTNELNVLASDIANWRSKFKELEQEVEVKGAHVVQQESQLQIQESAIKTLKGEVAQRRMEAEDTANHLQTAQMELQKFKEASVAEFESLKASHNVDLKQIEERAATEHTRLHGKMSALSEENRGFKEEIKSLKDDASSLTEELESAKKEIRRQKKLFTVKETKLAEALQFQRSLQTLIGQAAQHPEPSQNDGDFSQDPSVLLRMEPTTPSASTTRRRSRRITTARSTQQQPLSQIDEASHSQLHNRSFESSTTDEQGPTPKRAKPHLKGQKAFKVPVIRDGRRHTSVGATTSSVKTGTTVTSNRRRSALADVSGGRANLSPLKVREGMEYGEGQKLGKFSLQGGTKGQWKNVEGEQQQQEDEFDLDESGLFGSTPMLTQNPRTTEKNREVYDETTLEF
ncbi:hypothetical protein K402DRAFT_396287 [Aulographum hederae CBS 113979]|uniref:Uncharacterized protein n=1 Tax=Aulographum hederae CBS 113979 TaxID=1176131 RepID=A0A6G1GSM5_9PEZI|nr:hypothetical protein K402DRAFT_396287 [Aulographum hederae CBS 113979]